MTVARLANDHSLPIPRPRPVPVRAQPHCHYLRQNHSIEMQRSESAAMSLASAAAEGPREPSSPVAPLAADFRMQVHSLPVRQRYWAGAQVVVVRPRSQAERSAAQEAGESREVLTAECQYWSTQMHQQIRVNLA